MADSSTLQELLSRWEKEGRPPPDLFCKDTPDQLEAFKNAVEELQSMESFLASNDNTIDHTHSADQASADPNLISTKPKSDSQSESPSALHTGSNTSAIEKSERFLGRYQLRRRIGKGGFGEVWEAYHPDLKKTVAIKKPRGDERVAAQHVECFLSEAQKAAQLRHSAIVPVLDVVRDGDSWFIVSELIDGTNLKEHMANNRLPVERAVQIIAAIADALHSAHRKRLIHRDVKPGNILIDRQGQPYLTDFGLSLSEEDQQNEKGYIVGTLAYMSPEQVQGDNHLLDGRSDIFSLGVVLYELLTGERPFKGKTKVEVREQILAREPKPPRVINESIPRELERVCLKCLNKSIVARHATGADLATELRRSVRRQTPRRWILVAAIILVGALLVVAVTRPWTLLFQAPNQRQPMDSRKTKPVMLADGWAPLWTEMPEKLTWPGKASGSLLELKEEEKAIWLVSHGDAMIELGEVHVPSYKLRLTLKPLDWKKTMGLVLGRQKDHSQGNARCKFQLIRIAPTYPNKKLLFLLSHYSVKNYRAGFPMGVQIDSSPIEPPVGSCDLEISVENDQLKYVNWQGKIHNLKNSTNAHPGQYQGGFGFYARDVAVRLYRPRLFVVNGKS